MSDLAFLRVNCLRERSPPSLPLHPHPFMESGTLSRQLGQLGEFAALRGYRTDAPLVSTLTTRLPPPAVWCQS